MKNSPETIENEIGRIAETLFHLAKEKGLTLATAESLTCGMIAAKLGAVPGVSAVYKGGFVTYCDEMKHVMIDVAKETLEAHGAISKETAAEMCRGAAAKTCADAAVSATGNAGPSADEGKPVGLVYIGVDYNGKTTVTEYRFDGDRNTIRLLSVKAALNDLLKQIE